MVECRWKVGVNVCHFVYEGSGKCRGMVFCVGVEAPSNEPACGGNDLITFHLQPRLSSLSL